jgi:hypothetical protein
MKNEKEKNETQISLSINEKFDIIDLECNNIFANCYMYTIVHMYTLLILE